MCNLKTKSGFWSKCPHYIMGYITNVGSTFFLFSLIVNLAYIYYSLCQIWSVYMQHLRCCDCSNKLLFFVFQQAEMLLNFFWWVHVNTPGKPFRSILVYWTLKHGQHVWCRRNAGSCAYGNKVIARNDVLSSLQLFGIHLIANSTEMNINEKYKGTCEKLMYQYGG